MEQNSCHQLVVDKQLKWERRQKANRKINVIGSNSTFLPQLGGGGLLNTRSNIQNNKTNPEKRQLRTGIYMYVHCSPVMASFLCRNFVWVEFEDIQHCLGFLNIWQIEKKKNLCKRSDQTLLPNIQKYWLWPEHMHRSAAGDSVLSPALKSIIRCSAHRLHKTCLNTSTREILSIVMMATVDRETGVEWQKWSSWASTPD